MNDMFGIEGRRRTLLGSKKFQGCLIPGVLRRAKLFNAFGVRANSPPKFARFQGFSSTSSIPQEFLKPAK
jgi:hypothetical protein